MGAREVIVNLRFSFAGPSHSHTARFLNTVRLTPHAAEGYWLPSFCQASGLRTMFALESIQVQDAGPVHHFLGRNDLGCVRGMDPDCCCS